MCSYGDNDVLCNTEDSIILRLDLLDENQAIWIGFTSVARVIPNIVYNIYLKQNKWYSL